MAFKLIGIKALELLYSSGEAEENPDWLYAYRKGASEFIGDATVRDMAVIVSKAKDRVWILNMPALSVPDHYPGWRGPRPDEVGDPDVDLIVRAVHGEYGQFRLSTGKRLTREEALSE